MSVQTIAGQIIEAAPGIHTTGAGDWIKNNIVPLAILVIGVVILFKAHKRNLSDGLTIVAGLFLGLLVIGFAQNGSGVSVGTWLASLFTG